MDCVKWGEKHPNKSRLAIFGGTGYIIAGLSMGVASSLWAYRFDQEFYKFYMSLSSDLRSGIYNFANANAEMQSGIRPCPNIKNFQF